MLHEPDRSKWKSRNCNQQNVGYNLVQIPNQLHLSNQFNAALKLPKVLSILFIPGRNLDIKGFVVLIARQYLYLYNTFSCKVSSVNKPRKITVVHLLVKLSISLSSFGLLALRIQHNIFCKFLRVLYELTLKRRLCCKQFFRVMFRW